MQKFPARRGHLLQSACLRDVEYPDTAGVRERSDGPRITARPRQDGATTHLSDHPRRHCRPADGEPVRVRANAYPG